ncbi:MAG: flagellar biosynthetic protein FliO [Vicinamibacterales bacterium]
MDDGIELRVRHVLAAAGRGSGLGHAPPHPDGPARRRPAPISGQAIAAVVISLAVLAGAASLLRRGTLLRTGRQAVNVESAVALGERRSLVIVEVEGRRLLLGLTPVQVTLVTELERPSFASALDSSIGKGAPS